MWFNALLLYEENDSGRQADFITKCAPKYTSSLKRVSMREKAVEILGKI